MMHWSKLMVAALTAMLWAPAHGQQRREDDLEFEGVACDGGFQLACPESYYMVIVEATYGRQGTEQCPVSQNSSAPSDCEVTGALTTMSTLCNGRQSCFVDVSNQTFGGSCSADSPYLKYKHLCQLPYFNGLQCQEGMLYLACSASESIKVTKVFYGRENNTICGGRNDSVLPSDQTCSSDNATDIVEQLCHGRSYCELYATSGLFGNICPDVFKYLQVEYKCGSCRNTHVGRSSDECNQLAMTGECDRNVTWMTNNCRQSCWQCQYADTCFDLNQNCQYWASFGQCQDNEDFMRTNCKRSCNWCEELWQGQPVISLTKNVTTCQFSSSRLSCDEPGTAIRLQSVFYGVDSSTTCPNVTTNASCTTPGGTFSRVADACQGKPSCWFSARSELYGDSCTTRFKEGRVEYACQKCENAFSEDYCEEWAERGDCSNPNSYAWMHNNCFKTCTGCEHNGCVNSHNDTEQCDYFALRGECDNNPFWNTANCSYSCKRCTDHIKPDHMEKNISTCEAETVQLSCPSGRAIRIKSAFFGRENMETCPSDSAAGVTNCSSSTVTDSLSRLCTGKSKCNYDPWTTIYGDPCPGVGKAANASYSCQECKDEFGSRRCAAMAVRGHCQTNQDWMMDNCFQTCSRCNETECLNTAGDAWCDYRAQLNQCVDDEAYMLANCRESCRACSNQWITGPDILNSTTEEVCNETEAAQLLCPQGYSIHVQSLYFGRHNNDSCPHENATALNCSTPVGALGVARTLCEGRRSCWFSGEPRGLGDSCPGVPKTARIQYTCHRCQNAFSDDVCEFMKNANLCSREFEWMSRNCFRTCSGCDQAECGTYFSSQQCDAWAMTGQCEQNFDWMTRNCGSACRRCTNNWTGFSDKVSTLSTDICEDDGMLLQCTDPNYHLRIDNFVFGYMNTSCSANMTLDDMDEDELMNCTMADRALAQVIGLCEGRKSCWVEALTRVFGDTSCPNITKTARLTYTCQRCSNAFNDNVCNTMASRGDCGTNSQWMLDNCFRSCSACDRSTCGQYWNSQRSCDYWASIGQCQSNTDWMKRYCGESCRQCGLWQDAIGFTPQTTATMCQTQGRFLTCPEDFNIRIMSVFYGRTSSTICPSATGNTDQTCDTPQSAFNNVRWNCDGRQQCSVEARSELWGDACPAVYKSASVTFQCQECANVYSDVECDKLALAGGCTSDWFFMMDNCYKSCSLCNTTDCLSRHTSHEDCDYWSTRGDCTSNPIFMQQDCQESCRTCPSYRISQPDFKDTKREVFCEGETRDMVCNDAGYYIYVDMFYFGRYDNTTCPHPSVVISPIRNCPTMATAIARVQALCNGQKKCSVSAFTQLLGDPCAQIYKAAAFDYTCHLCQNAYNDNECDVMASNGFCQTRSTWMKKNCFKSCTGCDKADCPNEHSSLLECDQWALRNDCNTNPQWMSANCRSSCKKCGDLWNEEPADEPTRSVTICGGQSFNLRCVNPGYSLRVYDVFYGYDATLANSAICLQPPVGADTTCPSPADASSRVANICNGRTSCFASASDEVFGNLCPSLQLSQKIARIRYTCQKCVNAYNDSKCSEWAADGACQQNSFWMNLNCFKACSRCDVAECGNYFSNSNQCDEWAMSGQCRANPAWNQRYCGMSCLECGNVWKPQTVLLNPTSSSLCDGEVVELTCPANYNLRINNLIYGRVDNSDCSGASVVPITCQTPAGALNRLRRTCEGRQFCSVNASVTTFTDPCPGFNKTARIDFTCQVCNNVYLDSECDRMAAEGACNLNTTASWMIDNCYKACTRCDQSGCGTLDDISQCDQWAIGGECAANPDYMATSCGESCRECGRRWQGRADVQQSRIFDMCLGDDITLSCPDDGYTIVINRAYYGPDELASCSNTSTLRGENCTIESRTTQWVRDTCEGRRSCYLQHSTAALGDTCIEGNKVLQVELACQRCENAYNEQDCEQMARNGDCATQREFMFRHCYKSCSGCARSECGNFWSSDADCDRWALGGECRATPEFMTKNCGESCRRCGFEWTRDIDVPNTFRGEVCESTVRQLTCGSPDYRIWIFGATFGRDTGGVCTATGSAGTNCSSPANLTDTLRQVCNNRPTCTLSAYPDVLGDECIGETKIAKVDFACFECVNRYSDATCESMAADGQCRNDSNWMLYNCFKTCSECDKRECANSRDTEENCDNWAMSDQCSVNPDYMREACGLSCDRCGTEWQSVPDVTNMGTQTICQAGLATLACPTDGYHVRINSVFYGRSSFTVCADSGAVRNDCPQPEGIFARIDGLCTGRKSCDVGTYPSAYGDTCPGVSKYLIVNYSCQKCANAFNDTICEDRAANGGCGNTWVYENCYRTCSGCDKRGCGNYQDSSTCDAWAAADQCLTNPSYMKDYCAESCGSCNTDWNGPRDMVIPTPREICSYNEAELQCDNPAHYLYITSVFYGIDSNRDCFVDVVSDVNSCTDNAASTLRMAEACNGRPNCWFSTPYEDKSADTCGTSFGKAGRAVYSCHACVNAYGDAECAARAATGQCSSLWMVDNCFKACSQCDRGTGLTGSNDYCRNKDEDRKCDYWALDGECDRTRLWMEENCNASCGVCKVQLYTPPASTTAAPSISTTVASMLSSMMSTFRSTLRSSSTTTTRPTTTTTLPTTTSAKLTTTTNGPTTTMKRPADPRTTSTTTTSRPTTTTRAPTTTTRAPTTTTRAPTTTTRAPTTTTRAPTTTTRAPTTTKSPGSPVGGGGRCRSGYKGPSCSDFSCSSVFECSGHGSCTGPNTCTCDDGYQGNDCYEAKCPTRNECNGNGFCSSPDVCRCDPYWSGSSCQVCDQVVKTGPSCLPCPRACSTNCTFTKAVKQRAYLGCFRDNPRNLDLPHDATPNPVVAVTTQLCMQRCNTRGYEYAGLQGGNKCYCGHAHGKHGQVTDSTCSIECSNGEKCGGAQHNAVWRTWEGECE